jgi:hypothetical protein
MSHARPIAVQVLEMPRYRLSENRPASGVVVSGDGAVHVDPTSEEHEGVG